jgi:hypothetical protein
MLHPLQGGNAMNPIYVVAAGLLLAVGGLRPTMPSGEPRPVPLGQNETQNSSLVVTVSSNKASYKPGETARLIIHTKNTGKEDLTLHFSSSQSFDLQAFKPGETDASWTWSMDKMFAMVMRDQKLKAGEEVTFKANWEGLPAGEYNVVGSITAANGGKSAPISITVK